MINDIGLHILLVLTFPFWGAILLGILICAIIYLLIICQIVVFLIAAIIENILSIFKQKPKKKTKEVI